MKFYLLLSILISLCAGGHIYVSDTQLDYQNTGYLTSAQLYFKLDTDLYQNEVLKIVWPYTFNVTAGPVILSIRTSSQTVLSTAIAIADSTALAYLIRMQEKLYAQQWYILNISSVAQSPAVKVYTVPLQMSTHSGMSATGVTLGYLIYDYNNACGFIAVAPAPGIINSVVISDTETGISLPTNTAENTYYEANYPVYITILASGDYEYGGTFYFKITSGFKWTGSCEVLSKICDDNPTCITVLALSPSDYTCTLIDNLVTFKRYQNVSKLSINHEDHMRIKVHVQNPPIVDTGGVVVELVSNFANYIYEVLNKTSQFQTKVITLGTDNALFLWGLARNLAVNKGCPVRIYFTLHGAIGVWNKISLPFYPYLTLPDSTQGFYIQVHVNAASIVNDLSIYTDAAPFGSNIVTCLSDNSIVQKYITCRNIEQLIQNQTKHVKFAFIIDANDYADTTEFLNFGEIIIYNQQYESAVTAPVIPFNIQDSMKNSAVYTPDLQGNAVFDMEAPLSYGFTPAAAYLAVITRDGDVPAGRSSIKYTSLETNLFFPITTSFKTQCCEGYDIADKYDCPDIANVECKTITVVGTYGATLIFKMLANKNAISLNLDDLDTSVAAETNVYKGVELFPSSDGYLGMFGMMGLINGLSTNELLCLADSTNQSTRICSTYSKYVSYLDAKQTAGTLYLYNQWFLTSESLELHTVCYSGHSAPLKQVCGASENARKGVMIRHVKLNIVANNLYPQQTDLDFVMCFRYALEASTNLGKDETTKLATAALINAQILNFKASASEVISADGTMFRIGIINYFTATLDDHVINYVPTLLRIGGYMQASEVTQNSAIAFFFNKDNIAITDSKLSANMPLLPTECASPLVTGIVCRYYKSRLINLNIPAGLHEDYYPGLNTIVIGSPVVAKTEFNYYIPVWIKVPAFTFAFIGLINNHATFPTVSSVYKLFGTVENAQTAENEWKNYGVAGFSSFTIASLWTVQSTTGLGETKLNSFQDWESDGISLGLLNTYSGSAIIKSIYSNKLAYCTTDPIYPGDVATEIVIDASFDPDSTAQTDYFNDDQTMMIATTQTHSASMHFMVNSQIKHWSGDITWSLTNTSNIFSATCIDMTITSYYDSTHNQNQYLIICPYEGNMQSHVITMVNANATLKIANWAWPDYYGTDVYIGVHLRYMWTDRLGNLKAYLAEKKKGTARSSCLISPATEIFALTTNQKKAKISITPLNSIELLPATAAFKEKERILISVIVISPTGGALTTPKCSSGLPSIKCSVSKSVNTFNFILSNIDPVNSKIIPKSEITLTFWLSSATLTLENLSYQAKIFAYFYKKITIQESAIPTLVDDCNNAQPWTSGIKEDRSIRVSDPNFDVITMDARTPFSFTFSSSYTMLDVSKFNMNLAFYATSTFNILLLTNIRCFVYQGNTISHLFDKFTSSTLTAVEFEYKQQDTILDTATEMGPVNYTFLCNGGDVIPAAPAITSKILVSNSITTVIASAYGDDQSANYLVLRNVASAGIATVTLAKTFFQPGSDSTYTFNVRVAAAKVENSITSIRFQAGSYFYVEFPRDISPRFNKLGIIRCYQEDLPTYCNYEGERRISFIVRDDLDHAQIFGHNFSLLGVQRPFIFGNYLSLYVALVPYKGTLNSLEFQNGALVVDVTTVDNLAFTLPVVYYGQQLSVIKSTYSFTMHIIFPVGTAVDTIPIWVDFPEDFDEVMFLGWTPSCSFENVKIKDDDIISDFADSCTLQSYRRVRINLLNDINHPSFKLYALTISGIPVSNYEQYHQNPPLIWFGNPANLELPSYKTNIGYFNGTYNLKTFTLNDVNKQLLIWENDTRECYIGTYCCNAKLKPANLENFFKDIPSFTSTGTNSNLFRFNPPILSATTGQAYTQFEIAPKASTTPGIYQIQWNHEVTTYYTAIPPLQVIALNTPISIDAASSTYEVPNGGKSLPIIFNFAGKMPETDVTVTGVAKSLEVGGTTYITSKYVSFKETAKTLTYSNQYTSSQIQFVVTGVTVTGTNEPQIPSAILSWTLSGTNAISYANPSDVTVTVVSSQLETPELTLNTSETGQVGYQTIIAQCSQKCQ